MLIFLACIFSAGNEYIIEHANGFNVTANNKIQFKRFTYDLVLQNKDSFIWLTVQKYTLDDNGRIEQIDDPVLVWKTINIFLHI